MSALRIFHTSKPTTRFGPVLPMTSEQEWFWKLRRERADQRKEKP